MAFVRRLFSRHTFQFASPKRNVLSLSCCKMASSNAGEENGTSEQQQPRSEWPWRKAKKVAVMLSFCGKNYLGMQRNPGFKTIEEDLMKAIKESGAIPEDWYDNPQKSYFQRASRTDKGVSAAKMVVSLKLLCEDEEKTVDSINSHLPVAIRVNGIKRVTKNFNCKNSCDGRTYLYMMPTFAFAPIVPTTVEEEEEEEEEKDFLTTFNFKMGPEKRDKVNQVLKLFVGSHYFHNYTSGKLPLEPSSQRYITDFECGEPFVRDGIEFVVIKVKGQSFMLHQIRKMIGMTIAVVRGHASEKDIENSWGTQRIDVPRAPGLGLMLEEVHYERYNTRFGKDGFHEALTWEKYQEQIEAFKSDYIYPDIIEGEAKERSMFDWLKNLPLHTYQPRHFENEAPDESPLRNAAKLIPATTLEDIPLDAVASVGNDILLDAAIGGDD